MQQNISKTRLNFSLEAHEIELLLEEFLLPEITGNYFEFSIPIYAESLSGKVSHIQRMESKLTDQYLHLRFTDILLHLSKIGSTTPIIELNASISLSIDSTQLLSGKIDHLTIDLKPKNENPKSISSLFLSGGLKLIVPFLKTFLQKKIEWRIKLFPEMITNQLNNLEEKIQDQFFQKTGQAELKISRIESTIFPIKEEKLPIQLELSFQKSERPGFEHFFDLRQGSYEESAKASQLLLHPDHLPFFIPQMQTKLLGRTQFMDTESAELKSDGLYLKFVITGWTDATIISHWPIEKDEFISPAVIMTRIVNIKRNPAGWMLRWLKGMTEKKISKQIQSTIAKMLHAEIPGFSVPLAANSVIYATIDLQATESIGKREDQLTLNLNLSVSLSRQTIVPLLTSTTTDGKQINRTEK